MAFYIKQHDTAPAYVADLKDNFDTTPTAIDLTNATSVTFKMREQGNTGAPKVSSPMTIVSPSGGQVRHAWGASDTDTVGTYDVEFEIAWNDGKIETVPNGSDPAAQYNTVVVVDDLDV